MESRLCSSLRGHHQMRGTTRRSLHSHSNKNSNERDTKKRVHEIGNIYTVLLSSMFTIENNRENHPILNQIYDMLAELYNQEKHITLCKVYTH